MIEVVQCLPIGMLPTEFGVKLVAATPTNPMSRMDIPRYYPRHHSSDTATPVSSIGPLDPFANPISTPSIGMPAGWGRVGDTLFDDNKETRST